MHRGTVRTVVQLLGAPGGGKTEGVRIGLPDYPVWEVSRSGLHHAMLIHAQVWPAPNAVGLQGDEHARPQSAPVFSLRRFYGGSRLDPSCVIPLPSPVPGFPGWRAWSAFNQLEHDSLDFDLTQRLLTGKPLPSDLKSC